MKGCWTVDAAPWFCLWFTFFARSYGVALCWNSKNYWCLKEVAARCFLVISKTSVIITVLVWCWPRILDILLWYIWMQRLLTSDWGRPASSFCSIYCTWTALCLYTNRQVSDYLSVLNLIWQHCILICNYTLMHINKQGFHSGVKWSGAGPHGLF